MFLLVFHLCNKKAALAAKENRPEAADYNYLAALFSSIKTSAVSSGDDVFINLTSVAFAILFTAFSAEVSTKEQSKIKLLLLA